jgi:hypothetical protein
LEAPVKGFKALSMTIFSLLIASLIQCPISYLLFDYFIHQCFRNDRKEKSLNTKIFLWRLWLKCYSGRLYVSDCWVLGFEVGSANFFDFLCCFATMLKLKYQRFESTVKTFVLHPYLSCSPP